MKHLTAKPDVSMLAEPYRTVVAKALEKDPALRFPSAAEMLQPLPVPPLSGPGPLAYPGPLLGTLGAAWRLTAVTKNRSFAGSGTRSASSAPPGASPTSTPRRGSPSWLVALFVLTGRRAQLDADGHPAGDGLLRLPRRPRHRPGCSSAKCPATACGRLRACRSACGCRGGLPVGPIGASADPQAGPDGQIAGQASRQRLAELLGSMLAAALVAATMCLVMMIVAAYRGRRPPGRPDRLALEREHRGQLGRSHSREALGRSSRRGGPAAVRAPVGRAGRGTFCRGSACLPHLPAARPDGLLAGRPGPDQRAALPAPGELLHRRFAAAHGLPGLFRHAVPGSPLVASSGSACAGPASACGGSSFPRSWPEWWPRPGISRSRGSCGSPP